MKHIPPSDELRRMLVGKGLDEAKRQLDRVNKEAGRSQNGAARQFARRQEGDVHVAGVEMTISGGRVYRERPRLIVIDGGKR